MPRLTDLIPDEDILLALPASELAPYVLQAAKAARQQGGVKMEDIFFGIFEGETGALGNTNAYRKPSSTKLAVSEAWSWLEANQLIVRDPGPNGVYGSRQISRIGEALKTEKDFKTFQALARFPKHLLHPLIAEPVWSELIRGNFADAVFKAFKAVEEQVRDAGKFTAADYGVDLMRDAFHAERGPLTRMSDVLSERQALGHLFAGAIGSYKNPHSHRTVTISDPAEAQEIVLFATHLLRILDSRRF